MKSLKRIFFKKISSLRQPSPFTMHTIVEKWFSVMLAEQITYHAVRKTQESMRPVSTLTKIIDRSVKGDHKAFKELYHLFSRDMYMLTYRYMGNEHDAKDVLQQGFIKLYRDLYQYDADRGAFKYWMRRVFVNTALEQLRKRKLIKVELNGYHAIENFEDSIFDRFTTEEILDIIASLPGGYRTIINLYILEGYSHAEIAKMLEISESTSKSQLFKAKAKMRNLLQESHPEIVNKYVRKVRT